MAKMTAAEKEKRTPKFLKKLFSSPRKEKAKAIKASVKQGKVNKAATAKMYAAESMFTSAKNRDDNKVRPGKARSFKEAFDSATKAGKSKFMLGGKGYLTTKGKREDRFPVTSDKKKPADKKESGLSKFKSSKTLSEFFSKLKKKK